MKYKAAPPPKEALDYFNAKNLKTSFDYRDIWRSEHINSFTVAKAMKMDVLADIQSAVRDSIENGTTLHQFQKDLTPLLQKKGWWGYKDMVDPITGKTKTAKLGSPRRLRTIYETNKRVAYAAGQWQRIQKTKDSHPYLLYQLGPSIEHRLEHLGYNQLILHVDDPFWATHFPPNGWGCKCFVRSVSKQEYNRLKNQGDVITTAPKIKNKEFINKRTGEVELVPEGIDPGWDYNVGKDRSQWDKYGHLPDSLNTFKKGDYAKKITNQSNWNTLVLTSATLISNSLKLKMPPLLKKPTDLKQALLDDKDIRIITTPFDDVIIDSTIVNYLIKHSRDKQRYQFGSLIVPTLQNPNEIWLPKYRDGSIRPNYITYFKDTNMVVIVKIAKDGQLVWNAIPAKIKSIDNIRQGLLQYIKK